MPLVRNFYTGATIESSDTRSSSWRPWHALSRWLYVHSDGGRIGPLFWTNQFQMTFIRRDFQGGQLRIASQETVELPGSFEIHLSPSLYFLLPRP